MTLQRDVLAMSLLSDTITGRFSRGRGGGGSEAPSDADTRAKSTMSVRNSAHNTGVGQGDCQLLHARFWQLHDGSLADSQSAEHAISLRLKSESRGVLEQCVQALSLRCASMNLAVADTAYAGNYVDVTLLPQDVYVRARPVATAPAFSSRQPLAQQAAVEVEGGKRLMFNMSGAADVARVLDDIHTLHQSHQQRHDHQHQHQHQQQQQRQQQQRRAQTSYAQSNMHPLPSDEPLKHIGSMRMLADPRVELPLIKGSRVMVCRGNGAPAADRFPIPHASVSRQHAVVDVGGDGTCRHVARRARGWLCHRTRDAFAASQTWTAATARWLSSAAKTSALCRA